MHQFSFDFGDPFFDLAGWQVGLQVITFENTYGLDPDRMNLEARDGGFVIAADGLTWAGGQQKAEGRVSVTARRTGDGLELAASAGLPQKIRCTKLMLRWTPAFAANASPSTSGRGWSP
jgi:hypothetical protein